MAAGFDDLMTQYGARRVVMRDGVRVHADDGSPVESVPCWKCGEPVCEACARLISRMVQRHAGIERQGYLAGFEQEETR